MVNDNAVEEAGENQEFVGATADAAEAAMAAAEESSTDVVAQSQFDPTEMEDIQIARINTPAGREKFVKLLSEGYLCYCLYKVRGAFSIYTYSEYFDAVMAKKKQAE